MTACAFAICPFAAPEVFPLFFGDIYRLSTGSAERGIV